MGRGGQSPPNASWPTPGGYEPPPGARNRGSALLEEEGNAGCKYKTERVSLLRLHYGNPLSCSLQRGLFIGVKRGKTLKVGQGERDRDCLKPSPGGGGGIPTQNVPHFLAAKDEWRRDSTVCQRKFIARINSSMSIFWVARDQWWQGSFSLCDPPPRGQEGSPLPDVISDSDQDR